MSVGSNAAVTVASGCTLSVPGAFTGNLGGGLVISSSNAGTVIITGTNSYMPVTVNGGTLQMGNGAAQDGSFGPYSSFVDNGTMVIDNINSENYSGNAISGSGAFTKAGSGTLLFGSQSYTGATKRQRGHALARLARVRQADAFHQRHKH